MVALKRRGGRPAPPEGPGKQERRGGIETNLRAASIPTLISNQERRGGIETVKVNVFLPGQPKKQERRGGIETHSRSSPVEASREKQERRGGIETWIEGRFGGGKTSEAGTPWWH